ncbi:MAG: DUF3579 domain-containing protein [Zoogloeaceae bacterium]|jgi:hypothetical protein|nr:DUF3579 domain-containing protein [Zoogloeaceae bacterium]
MSEIQSFIILGITAEGKKFRPSDWADRLSGVLSAVSAHKKTQYSPYVSPGDYNGEKAVYVDGTLRDMDPQAYEFLRNFARDNDLQVVAGACPLDS